MPRLLGEPHERGFVPEIGLHRRVLQTDPEHALQAVCNRVDRRNGPLTSGDDINIVASLKV